MRVQEFASETCFHVHATPLSLEKEIHGVFAGDLLSWVMGNCEEGNCWITVQTHLNIVAIAALKEISCIVIAQGAQLPQETIEKAKEENIALFETPLSAYEVCLICHKVGC